jgi:uncharacterized protein
MHDALPPAESREPESTPPPIEMPALPFEPPLLVLASLPEREPPAEPPPPPAPPLFIETPRSSAELIAPTVVATAPPPPPPPPAAPAAQPAMAAAPVLAAVETGRGWAVFAHLLLFATLPIVFLGGTVTFLLWQLLGKENAFVEDQAREALNFQINVAAVSLLMWFSLIAIPLVIVLYAVACVMSLIAALHASRGERYRYPLILRIVSH